MGNQETGEARRRLWDAVDKVTRPTRLRLDREPEAAEWLRDLADDPTLTVCDVASYRAATVVSGEVPSLWQQATWALTTGTEQGGGGSPLRERSPADLDLMETMLTIRESLGWQLPGRGVAWRKPGDIPGMMRQLASHVAAHEPQHVEWWAFRFEQWGRLLAKHLHALDQAPRPVRLRNAPCPECHVTQVTIDSEQGPVVVPPILIDFDNGWIRAATCTACMSTWWRGDDLGHLADLLDDAKSDFPTEGESTTWSRSASA